MNILNRLVAIIVFLLILVLAVGTVGVATGLLPVSTVDKVHAYPPLHHALTDLANLKPMNVQVITVAIAALIAILMLWLLAREVIPPRPERTFVLKHDLEGEVTIGYDTLRKVAEQASLDVEHVHLAQCRVGNKKGEINVRCRATADPFTDAGAVGQQVEAAIQEQFRQTLGKPVNHVAVRVELERPGTPVRVR